MWVHYEVTLEQPSGIHSRTGVLLVGDVGDHLDSATINLTSRSIDFFGVHYFDGNINIYRSDGSHEICDVDFIAMPCNTHQKFHFSGMAYFDSGIFGVIQDSAPDESYAADVDQEVPRQGDEQDGDSSDSASLSMPPLEDITSDSSGEEGGHNNEKGSKGRELQSSGGDRNTNEREGNDENRNMSSGDSTVVVAKALAMLMILLAVMVAWVISLW